jgi:hypothetical protein
VRAGVAGSSSSDQRRSDPPATFEKAAVKYLNIWESFGRAACEQKQPGCARMEEILHNAAEAFQAAHQVDELRGAPTRVSSGLSERGRPATLVAR